MLLRAPSPLNTGHFWHRQSQTQGPTSPRHSATHKGNLSTCMKKGPVQKHCHDTLGANSIEIVEGMERFSLCRQSISLYTLMILKNIFCIKNAIDCVLDINLQQQRHGHQCGFVVPLVISNVTKY